MINIWSYILAAIVFIAVVAWAIWGLYWAATNVTHGPTGSTGPTGATGCTGTGYTGPINILNTQYSDTFGDFESNYFSLDEEVMIPEQERRRRYIRDRLKLLEETKQGID